jgi:hypothetical protein
MRKTVERELIFLCLKFGLFIFLQMLNFQEVQ